jgi:hypothetical protein
MIPLYHLIVWRTTQVLAYLPWPRPVGKWLALVSLEHVTWLYVHQPPEE